MVQIVDEAPDPVWSQHYPTYRFKHRDIALEEYRSATKSLEAEERIFLNASNIALVVLAGFGSLAVGSLGNLLGQFEKTIPSVAILAILTMLTAGFSWITLRYFADRQKSIVFAARKVIVLRKMLGLDYGSLQLVLPNWRIEGATEPFAVRLFPGWNTYVVYPLYALSGISFLVLFFLFAKSASSSTLFFLGTEFSTWAISIFGALGWAIFLAASYRKALLDTHESQRLLFAQRLSRLVNLELASNTEYIIYRSRLARYELGRISVGTSNLKKMLVFVEDKAFFTHRGISLRAIGRAILGQLRIRRRSGGSTITQQVVRTLFIRSSPHLYRRKIVEILLARWFDRTVSKNEQLGIYLASVRFERGVYGVAEAMRFFWGELKKEPTPAEAFFLIERVSNVNSRLLASKIIQTANAAKASELLTSNDLKEIYKLYIDCIGNGKIIDRDNRIDQLKSAFASES